jgi:hypothetical protein
MSEAKIEGAVVCVYIRARHGEKKGWMPTLADPELVNLGGRMFIAGTAITSAGHWAQGRRSHVAVDEIAMITEFDSREAYDDTMKTLSWRKRFWRR